VHPDGTPPPAEEIPAALADRAAGQWIWTVHASTQDLDCLPPLGSTTGNEKRTTQSGEP
jgi:hypothetical protein